MKKITDILILLSVCIALSLANASALAITNVQSDTIHPGEEGRIIITIENNLDDTIKDLSLSLDLASTPFTAAGSSEDSIEELEENDDGRLSFLIRASAETKPGDYNIPYTLVYSGLVSPRKGLIGIKVESNPKLEVSSSLENPIIGEQGKITLKIVNKGLANARFASIKLQPEGYTLLSESDVYIGTIDSDDFETASFDVIFKSQNSDILADLEYLDMDNKKVEQSIALPLKVYTKEKAIELGIIKKSNTSLYIILAVAVVIIWIIYRAVRKRSRMKKSAQSSNGS